MDFSHVILLFGGTSDERLVAVATAQNVASHLNGATAWFLSPSGEVFDCDLPALLRHARPFEVAFEPQGRLRAPSLREALDAPGVQGKVFFLALHGGEGEDGTVQGLMEKRGLAFTGSGSQSSRRAFDKLTAKAIARQNKVLVVEDVSLTASSIPRSALEDLLTRFGEIILKPVTGGSSLGIFRARSSQTLDAALEGIGRQEGVRFLAEPFVRGRELTVGVIETDRDVVALPPSEVIVAANHDFDYEGKYLGRGSQEITPAEITAEETREAQALALALHELLGCQGYSRSDLILTPHGPVYLETNTLPGLTRASFIPQQLAAAGIKFDRFLEDQVTLAATRALR